MSQSTAKKISKPEEMTEEYKKMVITLMDRQAGREISTAEVFGECLKYAPSFEDKTRLLRFAGEELKHFKQIAGLMLELGVDVETHYANENRLTGGGRFLGQTEAIDDWIEATLFNFFIDRAATFQLTEYVKGSYEPLSRANRSIVTEEDAHKDFGEQTLTEMCKDPGKRAIIQGKIKTWFTGAMRIFGRHGTPGNKFCLEVGLKTRDSGDIAAAYLDDIRPVLKKCGLKFPARQELDFEIAPQCSLEV